MPTGAYLTPRRQSAASEHVPTQGQALGPTHSLATGPLGVRRRPEKCLWEPDTSPALLVPSPLGDGVARSASLATWSSVTNQIWT